jgi:hypothetical protein
MLKQELTKALPLTNKLKRFLHLLVGHFKFTYMAVPFHVANMKKNMSSNTDENNNNSDTKTQLLSKLMMPN